MSEEARKLSDENLIRLVAEGEVLAFEEIDRRWRKALVAFVNRKVGNIADADDIAQEVLVRAWERASVFSEKIGTFRAWITKMAHNAILDRVRHSSRKKRGGAVAHTAILDDVIIDPKCTESHVDYTRLMELVQSLPCEERRAVQSILREESVASMAERTELSQSKISRLRASALQRMRNSVCACDGGEIIIRQPEVCTKRVQQTLF